MAKSTRFYEPLLVGILSLNFGILFFDRNAMNFLMPFVQPDLHLNNTEVGLIASVFSLTWAASAFFVANLSDRTGIKKPILVAVTFGFAVCSVLTGFAASFVALFATRFLMGVLEGGVLPISQSLAVVEVAPSRRGLAMGFLQNFGSNFLGSTAAAIILVWLATKFGWRNAFYLAGLPAAACALLMWAFVREPKREAKTAGVPAEHFTLVQALEQRNIVLCALISILMVAFLVICFAFLPLFLIHVRKFDPESMGLLIGVLGISASISGFAVPGVSDFIGRRTTMIAAPLFGIVAPLAALYFGGSFWALAALLFVSWTAVGVFPMFMATIPSETVDPKHTATATGLIVGVGEAIGGVFSPTIAGMAADHYGLAAPMWIMVVLPVVVSLLAFGLKETAPRKVLPASAALDETPDVYDDAEPVAANSIEASDEMPA